jgi:hypothetical protein
MESKARCPMLLDQVRNLVCAHHYSIHTERSYLDRKVRGKRSEVRYRTKQKVES